MTARTLLALACLGLSAPTAAWAGRPLAIPGGAPPPRDSVARPPPPPAPAPVQAIATVRPHHGVFVYGPRPVHHAAYRAAPGPVQQAHLPRRWVERDQTFAIGLRAGSLISGYRDGTVFGDFGLGLVGRYRPVELFAVELLAQHHNASWGRGTERAQTLGQLSGAVFITPWARVSPYVLGGLTLDVRHVDDVVDLTAQDTRRTLFGPHAGVGLEIAIGRSLALDLDGRFTGYVNLGDDRLSPRGAFQVGGGLVAHF